MRLCDDWVHSGCLFQCKPSTPIIRLEGTVNVQSSMSGRLKKKLGNLGVDPSSAKANESFCFLRLLYFIFLDSLTRCLISCRDWHPITAPRESEGHGRVCSTTETRRMCNCLSLEHSNRFRVR